MRSRNKGSSSRVLGLSVGATEAEKITLTLQSDVRISDVHESMMHPENWTV